NVGTMSGTGLYTAPASVTVTQAVVVTATSASDPSKAGTAAITLVPPPALVVLPPTPVLASIAPVSGVIGSSQPVTFTGTSLNGAILNLSAGITATAVVSTSTQITATLVASANAPLGPASITVTTSGGTSNTVTFTLVHSDTTTQGTWKPVYGAGGQAIPNNVTNYPAYAQVAFTGQTLFTWSPSTADVRAPQKGISAGRVASAWYSFTSFSIDINLTDGLTHQVALYGLDWDGANTRAQRIDVLNPATGQVLATTPMTAFSAGQYLVWNLTGHVTLRVTRTAGISAVVSGLLFDGGSPLVPALAAVAPATGVIGTTVPVTITGANLIGANLNLGAGITATGVVATATKITATFNIAATAPVGPQTISVTTPGGDSGAVTFTVNPMAPTLATVTPAVGVLGTSVPVTLTGANLTGAALHLGAGITATGVVVTATQITANLAIAATAPLGPQTISVTTLGGTSGTVTFTVNPPAPTLTTVAPTLAATGTSVPLTLTGTNLLGAALNLRTGITANVVITATQITGTIVVAPTALLGPANITVTTAGGTSNAATFTIVAPSGTVAFVKADTTTQGTWKTVYGADGEAIANDVTNYPAYAQVALTGQAAATWVTTTADVRGLQKGVLTGRIAATWFATAGFNIDINLTDGLPHQVALYCLDWDAVGRAERIDVLDTVTGQVLASSSVSAFASGQYLVWNLSGHVTLRVTKTAGTNAVVSGVFFK
ncbi:MAG TPA: hypothetical protein VNY05_02090, partial [Candidatus Acidoferrales bacterium]|nr:hypothetical protein [Candidatus Acidoferrales bacterium]